MPPRVRVWPQRCKHRGEASFWGLGCPSGALVDGGSGPHDPVRFRASQPRPQPEFGPLSQPAALIPARSRKQEGEFGGLHARTTRGLVSGLCVWAGGDGLRSQQTWKAAPLCSEAPPGPPARPHQGQGGSGHGRGATPGLWNTGWQGTLSGPASEPPGQAGVPWEVPQTPCAPGKAARAPRVPWLVSPPTVAPASRSRFSSWVCFPGAAAPRSGTGPCSPQWFLLSELNEDRLCVVWSTPGLGERTGLRFARSRQREAKLHSCRKEPRPQVTSPCPLCPGSRGQKRDLPRPKSSPRRSAVSTQPSQGGERGPQAVWDGQGGQAAPGHSW